MSNKIWKVIAGNEQDKLQLSENLAINCYVLENKMRVISELGLTTAIGFSRGKPPNTSCSIDDNPNANIPTQAPKKGTKALKKPRFTVGTWLLPYLDDKTLDALNSPVKFKSNSISYGYQATLLVDIANAVIAAYFDNATTSRQNRIVNNARRIVTASAKLGINALIDAITGYEPLREDQELQKFFAKFLTEQPREWKKTYPDEYYQEIYRLNGWQYPPVWKNHPQVVAHWTITAVYDRLAPLLIDELQERNPTTESGHREHLHHQFLSAEHGYPLLEKHLYAITSLMRSCSNWKEFERAANRAFPLPGTPIEMNFPNDLPN